MALTDGDGKSSIEMPEGTNAEGLGSRQELSSGRGQPPAGPRWTGPEQGGSSQTSAAGAAPTMCLRAEEAGESSPNGSRGREVTITSKGLEVQGLPDCAPQWLPLHSVSVTSSLRPGSLPSGHH